MPDPTPMPDPRLGALAGRYPSALLMRNFERGLGRASLDTLGRAIKKASAGWGLLVSVADQAHGRTGRTLAAGNSAEPNANFCLFRNILDELMILYTNIRHASLKHTENNDFGLSLGARK